MREMSSAMTISASRVSSLIDMDDDESITKMLRKENPLYGGIIPPFVRCAPRPIPTEMQVAEHSKTRKALCRISKIFLCNFDPKTVIVRQGIFP